MAVAREGLETAKIPAQGDESIMTTLRVIMDVLKSHDGSIKQLQKWLDNSNESGKSSHYMKSHSKDNISSSYVKTTPYQPPIDEAPVHDGPDDRSEVSSIVSCHTEYQELPSRSTINNSTVIENSGNYQKKANGSMPVGGIFSTPIKATIPSKDFPDKPSENDGVKFDSTLSSIDGDDTLGEKIVRTAWKAEDNTTLHENQSMKASLGNQLSGNLESPVSSNIVGLLQAKLNLLESQVNEWGEIMDEMSNRMAKQPSLIRKFAKESSSDKVPQSQYIEDLELLEKRIQGRMDEKLSSVDRKVIDLHHDVTTRLNAKTSPSREKYQYAKQETAVQLSIEMETISEQFEDQKKKIRIMEKDLTSLEDVIQELKHDVNMCRHQLSNRRSDGDLVSLVAEQLLEKEEITGWRTALKEMHSALNKQSDINTSLHHSYASLDKKMSTIVSAFPLHGRWRWSGLSSVFPKSHSCTNGHHAQDIHLVSQLLNTDTRTFIWEKNKPYIVISTAGCYWVKIGAFASKSSSPPSLQITVDEEPVALFNSSGKSPTSYKISVTSSAPKNQATSRHRSEISPWRPGSSLSGAIMIPGHSRLGIWAASTVSGTRLSVEGYIEIHKVY